MGAVTSSTRRTPSGRQCAGHASLPFFLFAFLAGLLVHSSYFDSMAALRSQMRLQEVLRERSIHTDAAIQKFEPTQRVSCRAIGQASSDPGLSPRVCRSGMLDRNDIPLFDYNRIFASITVCPIDACRVPEELVQEIASNKDLVGSTVRIRSNSARFLASLRSIRIDSLKLARSSTMLLVATGDITIGNLLVDGGGTSSALIFSTSGNVAVNTIASGVYLSAKGARGTSIPPRIALNSLSSEFAAPAPITALVP
jgi:hypothetical protein